MKRIVGFSLLFFSIAIFSHAQELKSSPHRAEVKESIQKEYPLVPTEPPPYIDEGSYSPRDEAWIRNPNPQEQVHDLLKALAIVGILLTILCIFMVTGSSDVKWEQKIAKENIPSDQ